MSDSQIFLAATISVVLFSLIFLVLRGTLALQGGVKLKLYPHQRLSGHVGTYEEYYRFIGAITRSMLWWVFSNLTIAL